MIGSFLKKLKKKKINLPSTENVQQQSVEDQVKNAVPKENIDDAQLNVDIFQNPNSIIIYAQIAGAGVQDFSILIQGDGDIITIRGQRTRPDGQVLVFDNKEEGNVEKILEECNWGKFYRQIILPAEVDSSRAEAKMKNGVLVVSLPLKGSHETGGIRINVSEV